MFRVPIGRRNSFAPRRDARGLKFSVSASKEAPLRDGAI